jgi:DNA polymerase-3 subunit epsilon
VSRPGVAFRDESALFDRALALIREEPRRSEDLAATVLGIKNGPPAVTHRLVRELLKPEPRLRHDDGLWRLTNAPATADGVGFDGMRFVVVDVETTGGVAGQGGHIIEFAAVRIERRQIVDSFTSLVDPGVSVSPWITRLTGIRNGMIRGAPTFAEILPQVRRQLDGSVFVAHSVGYDWGFIREELRRLGEPVPRGSRLCTVQFARRLLPGLERRGLDSLARYYGVEIQERHRARGDAIATARCFLKMLDDAERKGWSTWEDLQREMTSARKEAKKTGKKDVKRKTESESEREAARQARLDKAARLEGRDPNADR